MDREGYTDNTKFFIGTEVEHTPAYGQRTLFVIGLQNPKEILARALNNNCPHIYLGANQSFNPTDAELVDWDFMCIELLKNDIWVTLDYDVSHHENILEGGMTEYDTFDSSFSHQRNSPPFEVSYSLFRNTVKLPRAVSVCLGILLPGEIFCIAILVYLKRASL